MSIFFSTEGKATPRFHCSTVWGGVGAGGGGLMPGRCLDLKPSEIMSSIFAFSNSQGLLGGSWFAVSRRPWPAVFELKNKLYALTEDIAETDTHKIASHFFAFDIIHSLPLILEKVCFNKYFTFTSQKSYKK